MAELRKVRGVGDQKVCKVFRGNNYTFWLENYKNKFGAFLKLSLCGRNGFVNTIIIPKGQRDEGWKLVEEGKFCSVPNMPCLGTSARIMTVG